MLPTAGHTSDKAKPPEYLLEIVRFLRSTRFEDLPPAVVDRCKRLVADTFAVVTAGNQASELKALASGYLEGARPGPCWVIGTPHRASARDAGFLNGVASTFHDFDEGNTVASAHPGSQMVPAAIAAAQELGVSGRNFLLAVVMAYEACARTAMASKMRVSVPQHGNVGTIGSAVAAAHMKGFDEERMRHTINTAAMMAMTANRQAMLDEATTRNVFSGHCALAGLIAVQMIEAGFTGQRDGIGYTYGTVIADGFEPERMVAGLGTDWLITKGYFKLHPAGRFAHAAIDAFQAALATVPAGSIGLHDIERIDVKAFQLASLLSGRRITTSFGAHFSIPFALATIFVHGRSGIDCFDIDAVRNPDVQALTAKVHVVEEPAYTRLYPEKHRCDVAIRLNDRRTIEGHCEIMQGEAANPHPPEAVERKFFDLTIPVWGADRAEKLYKGLLSLEKVPDMRTFGADFAL
jgi:2-methylcitrate dehydratase PrpD